METLLLDYTVDKQSSITPHGEAAWQATVAQIERDVQRAFSERDALIHRDLYRDHLRGVLQTYIRHHHDLTYTQGMDQIACNSCFVNCCHSSDLMI